MELSLDSEEIRVLGVLVEKGATTPDQYPMTLNGVRVGCNQASNRDPVLHLDEATVEKTLRRLADRALAKMVHRPGDRVVKYRHALGEKLELGEEALAVLAVLLLRGTQTPGELRQRTTRYVEFTSLPAVEQVLDDLAHHDPPLVERLGRRPGQKEVRYRHLIGTGSPTVEGDSDDRDYRRPDADDLDTGTWTRDAGVVHAAATGGGAGPVDRTPAVGRDDGLREELADLAAEVAELRRRFDTLLDELGVDHV
jgi:uncharacterized protein YceH (UPF0502 family)